MTERPPEWGRLKVLVLKMSSGVGLTPREQEEFKSLHTTLKSIQLDPTIPDNKLKELYNGTKTVLSRREEETEFWGKEEVKRQLEENIKAAERMKQADMLFELLKVKDE